MLKIRVVCNSGLGWRGVGAWTWLVRIPCSLGELFQGGEKEPVGHLTPHAFLVFLQVRRERIPGENQSELEVKTRQF